MSANARSQLAAAQADQWKLSKGTWRCSDGAMTAGFQWKLDAQPAAGANNEATAVASISTAGT